MIPMYPYVGKETICEEKPITFPPQHQARQPGLEYLMNPIPISENPSYLGSSKLMNKVAIITGGDSGWGGQFSAACCKIQRPAAPREWLKRFCLGWRRPRHPVHDW